MRAERCRARADEEATPLAARVRLHSRTARWTSPTEPPPTSAGHDTVAASLPYYRKEQQERTTGTCVNPALACMNSTRRQPVMRTDRPVMRAVLRIRHPQDRPVMRTSSVRPLPVHRLEPTDRPVMRGQLARPPGDRPVMRGQRLRPRPVHRLVMRGQPPQAPLSAGYAWTTTPASAVVTPIHVGSLCVPDR